MTSLSRPSERPEPSTQRFIGFVRYQALRLRAFWTHWSLDALAAEVDPASDPALIVRAHQLGSARNRRRLAGRIERVLAEAEARHSPALTAVIPIAREQVAEAREPLLFLAHLLRHAVLVQPRGIAMVEQILTNGSSVLYVETARGALALELQVALDCLVGEWEATPEAWFSASDDRRGELVAHGSAN